MFGEHESESPRVPSPWDPFLPSPPTDLSGNINNHVCNGVPKLVPEAEEGNVEYKLKLTHISPARFARLVTQLKWRLLEGGGQAYYELGVADSGALIGLSRADLEASLETLEMMAGEIGASVIVVKEIEVPPSMYALAEEASKFLDPVTGGWTRKMRKKTTISSEDDTATTTETETETDFSVTDFADLDDSVCSQSSLATPLDSAPASPRLMPHSSLAHRISSHPNRPTAQSSPYIAPLDDDLALFSMEPEAPHVVITDDSQPTDSVTHPSFSVYLEIASVYKPRPIRRRAPVPIVTVAPAAMGVLHGKNARRVKYKEKEKVKPWHKPFPSTEKDNEGVILAGDQDNKAMERRLARDQRREEKRKQLIAKSGSLAGNGLSSVDMTDTVAAASVAKSSHISLHSPADAFDSLQDTALVTQLDALHVAVSDSTNKVVKDLSSPAVDQAAADYMTIPDRIEETTPPYAAEGREPRLIVEALVVRKLSIEEAFLDFGGFQLV